MCDAGCAHTHFRIFSSRWRAAVDADAIQDCIRKCRRTARQRAWPDAGRIDLRARNARLFRPTEENERFVEHDVHGLSEGGADAHCGTERDAAKNDARPADAAAREAAAARPAGTGPTE